MKCCSRSTLGVIIGILNILTYIGVSVFMIKFITDNAGSDDNVAPEREEEKYYIEGSIQMKKQNIALRTLIYSTVLAVSLLMVIISGLLIMGIVKRRHKLIWPWLALSGLGFACNCLRIIFSIVVGLATGMDLAGVLALFIGGVLGLGIHALILWPIYTLCRDISEKNNQKPGQLVGDTNYTYVAPPDAPPKYSYDDFNLPQKS